MSVCVAVSCSHELRRGSPKPLWQEERVEECLVNTRSIYLLSLRHTVLRHSLVVDPPFAHCPRQGFTVLIAVPLYPLLDIAGLIGGKRY